METSEDSLVIDLQGGDIYQEKNLILQNVIFKVPSGELVYLIGKTGSGKSSLLRTLYCDINNHSVVGKVVGFQIDKIKRSDIAMLRRKMGIIFQDFQLLSDRDAMDNLRFVLKSISWKDKKEIEQKIESVLSDVGLNGKGHHFPHQLSGGEQQRLAIARSLLNDPKVIVADEPTGNLDPETSKGIMSLLSDISKKGTAVVIATHDYALIKNYPGRILKCEEGNLIEN